MKKLVLIAVVLAVVAIIFHDEISAWIKKKKAEAVKGSSSTNTALENLLVNSGAADIIQKEVSRVEAVAQEKIQDLTRTVESLQQQLQVSNDPPPSQPVLQSEELVISRWKEFAFTEANFEGFDARGDGSGNITAYFKKRI